MNVIIIGCGRVGSHLATLLSDAGENVCIIDRRPKSFEELDPDFNGRTVRGDGRDEDVLEEAGIEECDVLAAVTSNDNLNLMMVEVARRIYGVEHVITRLFSPKRENAYMKVGVDFACGTTLVAEEIFAKILSGHGHHIDTFGDYELVRFALNLGEGQAIRCADIASEFNARVMVYEHNDQTFLPDKNSVLHDGDVAIVCVSKGDFGEFSHYMRS